MSPEIPVKNVTEFIYKYTNHLTSNIDDGFYFDIKNIVIGYCLYT